VQSCELCGGNHTNGQCAMKSTSQEEVSYMGNQGRPGNYNQGWRPQQNLGQVGPSNRPPHKQTYQHPSLSDRTSKLEDMMQQFMQMSIQNQKNTDASIKNLEVQVGQLAKQLADQQGGSFSANTQANPKEQCQAIFTRSGKEVGLGSKEKVEAREKKKNEETIQEEEVDEEIVVEEEVNKREENEKEKKKKRESCCETPSLSSEPFKKREGETISSV